MELTMKKASVLFFLLAFTMISCKDNNSANVLNLKSGMKTLLLPSQMSPDMEDFLNEYDQSNVIGYIALEKKKYDIMHSGNIVHDYSVSSYAFISNDNRDQGRYVGGNITVNASALEQYHLGSYLLVGDGPIDANFGSGTNKFLIETDDFPYTEGTASFASPMQISNLSLNQNISKSNDLTINWTGGKSGELVQISILKKDMIVNGVPQGTYIKTNSNSVTISSAQLTACLGENGQYSILLTSYDPTYVDIDGGKKICFIGVYKHEITVNITN